MSDDAPQVEALAISGERVIAVGTRGEVLGLAGDDTRVVELPPRWCVLPGLVDAHAHLDGLGDQLATISLVGTTSPEECAARVLEWARSTPAGRWIQGKGWDQNDWPTKEYPHWRDLAGTESNPVYLRRIDGHAAWLNRAALDAAGITRDTPDPRGGRIERDRYGEPTGIVIDNATNLVTAHIPDISADELDRRMRAAVAHCVALGLTGVHDAGATAETIASWQRLWDRGELPLRVYAMLDGTDDALLASWFDRGRATLCDGHLVVRAVKLYADGALGSRGAALIEPYDDDPGNRGLLVDGEERMRQVTRRAYAAGFQTCTHAIGDRGNRLTLDVYGDVLATDSAPASRRFRIEHCQVVAPEDFERFRDLGVIAAMQPTHATSDMYWAEDRIGPERIRGAYAWRRFLDLGVPLAFGSDFPVESANPFWGIYAAVTRRDQKGWPAGGWYPDQCLSVAEALRAFTVGAAFAGFTESHRGTLAPGMDADVVVVDRDVFAVDPSQLLGATVQLTIVAGEIVYEGLAGD
jgi:hypothetical protein